MESKICYEGGGSTVVLGKLSDMRYLAVETALVDDPNLFRVRRDTRAGVLCDSGIDLCGVSLRASLGDRMASHTFVMMTSSSRGRLNCLIAFPRMISERPLEYT